MQALWIPLVGIFGITIILISFFYFKNKTQTEVQTTIRQSLDKGAELTPELIEILSISVSPKVADFRKGIVLTALGIACALAGWIGNAMQEGATIAMFPLMLGIGFLTVWKMNQYD